MVQIARRRRATALLVGLFATALLVAGMPMLGGSDRQAAVAEQVGRLSIDSATGTRTVGVRDRLIAGLQARLESEIAFIDRVIEAVEMGKLPQRMVDQTFFWAPKRAGESRDGRTHRPIVYFLPAMMLRAQKIGVEL